MASSPYDTATVLNIAVPSHVTAEDDIPRIRSYVTYQAIWDNVDTAFAALLRASDDPLARRYVPMAREIVEAINRYLGQDMETVWTPIIGATVDQKTIDEWNARWMGFWIREEMGIKFMSSKRWMLIKGDTILHVTGDPSKAEGSRISVNEIEAEQYFRIPDPTDITRVKGCFLSSVVLNDEDDEIIQRIEYRKVANEDESAEFNGAPIGSIFYRLGFFEPDGWDNRDPEDELKPVEPPSWAPVAVDPAQDPYAGFALDARITSIPVYHIRNRRRGGKVGQFGTSELQGLESLLAGIIQNATDEDFAVALQGLGFYWTNSGRARDANGKEVDWVVSPASIAELEADGQMGRVDGITSVQPIQDHIGYLGDKARSANGAPAIASGQVSTDVALSGVALRIHFMPVLAANAEREEEMASKWAHLLYDLANMWFPVYEGWNALPLQPSVVFGDPLPADRAATIKEVTDLVTAGIASKEWAVSYLAEKLGFKFPSGMLEVAQAEQQAALDAEAAQIAANAGQLPE
jgi:hypothetical protein